MTARRLLAILCALALLAGCASIPTGQPGASWERAASAEDDDGGDRLERSIRRYMMVLGAIMGTLFIIGAVSDDTETLATETPDYHGREAVNQTAWARSPRR